MTPEVFGRCFSILVLALAASSVSAEGRFVASSRVSGDGNAVTVEIQFSCKITNVEHELPQGGDQLRISFDATGICNGVAPSSANSRGRYRPAGSERAALLDFEYDGESAAGPTLTLNFDRKVTYVLSADPVSFRLSVTVNPLAEPTSSVQAEPNVLHRQVIRPQIQTENFVVNLASYRRPPTVADLPSKAIAGDRHIFYTEVDIDGSTWFRLRLGDFESSEEAQRALASLAADYPGAWIEQPDPAATSVDLTALQVAATASVPSDTPSSEVATLMAEARQTMIDGDRSRAIQIYTKILQLPEHPMQIDAQEYLALAREKNGQIAHAKAEYQRYLSLYPDSEGTVRVRQRLAALVASDRQPASGVAGASAAASGRTANDWRLQTFFSQYYRRDVNQQTDQQDTVSQSALYSDVNVDARRRGERFDLSARISAGYRSDFLDEGFGSGNDTRISYAYADIADAKTGLRGRIGRQSRNSGGVLGRFDGLNLGYQLTERVLINTVIGKPAYSANDGVDSARTFYGASVNYGPVLDGLELGAFFVHQTIEGIDDRQAIGGEFRYFGANQSVWGMVDYDTLFSELSSAFLQASWRLGSRLTLNGSFDRRHSPFLSTGNALIGQPVTGFADLAEIFSEDELRQLGLDRSPLSTAYSVGMSYSLTPSLQISADANETSVASTPDSGGVFGMPASDYSYFAVNMVASSLFREGDVSILTLRQSSSDTTDVLSLSLDSRFPFGRSWRVNPRLRVDRRDREGDLNYEWIYTPGIRVQYRRGQRLRFDFEAGKQFFLRDVPDIDLDRESYFVNVGYQLFF